MIKVWTLVFSNGEQGYSTDNANALVEELQAMEADDEITVTMRLMPSEEFNAMQEWTGA